MNKLNSAITEINKQIARLAARKQEIVAQELAEKSKWRRTLAVQLKTGETVGFADSFLEAEALMKAHAEKVYAEAVAQCRAKHVKIVAAEVPESDYVLTETWVRA